MSAAKLLGAFALTSFLSLGGCAATDFEGEEEMEGFEGSEEALRESGGLTTLHYLGSSSFLRRCAGDTLGCGRKVASVSDDTPYFSAPRTWSKSRTCEAWFTFRRNGQCVEARRLEVSDRRNFIEGNPALFDGLGLRYSDGRNCAGWGTYRGVTVTPGRHCASSDSPPGAPPDADPSELEGPCWSPTLQATVDANTCVQSKSNRVWFQCMDGQWYRGGDSSSGPFGPCVGSHPL